MRRYAKLLPFTAEGVEIRFHSRYNVDKMFPAFYAAGSISPLSRRYNPLLNGWSAQPPFVTLNDAASYLLNKSVNKKGNVNMLMFNYTIKDELGIHARPAGQLAKIAKELDSEITISLGGKSAAATKLLALMGMGVKCGDTITVTINGGDEQASQKAVKEFLGANL